MVVINIFPGEPSKEDPKPLMVDIQPLDTNKRVVFDTTAKNTFNSKLTEKARSSGLNASDPKLLDYIKEFTGRLISELYKHDLIALEDIPEASDDPYKVIRNQYKNRPS